MLIDSHCHIDDARLADKREEVLKGLVEHNVSHIINIGYDMESSLNSVNLAKEYDNIFAAVGMHPHDSKDFNSSMLYDLEEYAKCSKVVAIGEIGLDYYYDKSPRDVQQKVFMQQVELAHSLKMPIVIHLRDAYQDMQNLLVDNKRLLEYGLLIHCYTGSSEMVKVYEKLGAYFALGGAVTFSKKSLQVYNAIPRDRLLLETDSPYLTPVPYRGKLNYPHNVRVVAEYLATISGDSIENIEKCTYENTIRYFNLRLK